MAKVYVCIHCQKTTNSFAVMYAHLQGAHGIPFWEVKAGRDYEERIAIGPPSDEQMAREGRYVRVADMEKRPDLIFVSDSQDVEAIKEYIGGAEVKQYGSFFVKTEEGEYVEVWGMEGTVPYKESRVYPVPLPHERPGRAGVVTVRAGEVTRVEIHLTRKQLFHEKVAKAVKDEEEAVGFYQMLAAQAAEIAKHPDPMGKPWHVAAPEWYNTLMEISRDEERHMKALTRISEMTYE